MKSALGLITAHLDTTDSGIPADLIAHINENINPPTPVTEHDVYIRAMFLVSDEINAYGGCFPADEHLRLATLLIDSPVLVGHRKDTLPIGRTFHAVCTERDGRNWVKSYFYWLRSSEGAETLRENIDGGIYKECSIGFTYLLPECSICGHDIRACRHEPMQTYASAGSEQLCHFNYRRIERVLESSLVYRGATPDTSVSRELTVSKLSSAHSLDTSDRINITTLDQLPSVDRYLVTPAYAGLDCRLSFLSDTWSLSRSDDSQPLPFPFPPSFHFADRNTSSHRGRLVAYRGRERCPLPLLEQYLAGQTTAVTRLILYIYPNSPGEQLIPELHDYPSIKMMRHRFTIADHLAEAAAFLTTRDGVEILTRDSATADPIVHYFPDAALHSARCGYALQPMRNSDHWLLELRYNGRVNRYLLRQFNLQRFARGARFVADKMQKEFTPNVEGERSMFGSVATMRYLDNGCCATLAEPLATTIALRPIKLDGRSRYLVYQTNKSIPLPTDSASASTPARRTPASLGRHSGRSTPMLSRPAANQSPLAG